MERTPACLMGLTTVESFSRTLNEPRTHRSVRDESAKTSSGPVTSRLCTSSKRTMSTDRVRTPPCWLLYSEGSNDEFPTFPAIEVPTEVPDVDPPTPEDNSVDKWAALCIHVPAPATIHRCPVASPTTYHWRPHRNAPLELRRWQASTLPTAPTTATDVLSIKKTLTTRAVDGMASPLP
jgi:hypothetical protein